MILIKIYGGLGNQMFQYAFGRTLAHKFNTKLILDTSLLKIVDRNTTKREFELEIFSIKVNFANSNDLNKFRRTYINRINSRLNKMFRFPIITKSKIIYEADYEILNKVSPNKLIDTLLFGSWQSEKYFSSFEKEIRNDFKFRRKLDEKNLLLAERIKATNSISIHIRRGDYADNLETNKTHGLCTIDYYIKSINYIKQIIENPMFFIFSDDIEWATRNLKIDDEHEFITWNKNKDSSIDMQMMSYCKHNIIANSSFSWWGAWLNSNPNKIVIAPKRWFANETKNLQTNNLIPETWLRL